VAVFNIRFTDLAYTYLHCTVHVWLTKLRCHVVNVGRYFNTERPNPRSYIMHPKLPVIALKTIHSIKYFKMALNYSLHFASWL
jgi:hypothetical protein